MRLINLRKGSRNKLSSVSRDTLKRPEPGSFAERLRELMQARGLKNPDVASAAGVDPVTVSQWRSGRQHPSDETLERIAPLLGTTAAFLRFGTASKVNALHERAPAAYGGREPFTSRPSARSLSTAVREFLAEAQLEMVKAGALEDEVSEALDLLKSPQIFTFYQGGAPKDFSEEQVLVGMRAIYRGVIKPELKKRGRTL